MLTNLKLTTHAFMEEGRTHVVKGPPKVCRDIFRIIKEKKPINPSSPETETKNGSYCKTIQIINCYM